MLDKQPWKQFKTKVQNIDMIAQWALAQHIRKISEKYNNIDNTIKILNSMIQDFGKKADNFEENLKGKTRIQELQYQKQYYQKRITQCLDLSEQLKENLWHKKNNLLTLEAQVWSLKRKLIISKTQNIKKIMKINSIENRTLLHEQQHQQQQQKKRRKQKKQHDRSQIIKKQSSFPLENILLEKDQLETALYEKITKTIKVKQLMKESYLLLKERLHEHEKRSSKLGLVGSLYFRLENDRFPAIAKNTDSKLLIYNILRQKYKRIKRQQKKHQEQFYVEEDQFINFNPLQIIGIIELKGGYTIINDK